MHRSIYCWCLPWMGFAYLMASTNLRAGVNYEEAPIHYSRTTPENRVSRLQQRLSVREIELEFEAPHGYLSSVLKELQIPVSSQVLVFSKTSLQKDLIGPRTPRAHYFNEEVHLGYVDHGVIELAVTDPRLGMVFYTLEQSADQPPSFQQRTNSCLTCHSTGRTRNVPGLQVRSVFPSAEGEPVIAAGSFLSTHASPIAQRWGGWYVTGTHGAQAHLGNLTLTEKRKPKTIDNTAGQNLVDLTGRFDAQRYLSPHSDVVALMVLEHQADTLNALTQASFDVREALHQSENPSSLTEASPADDTLEKRINRAAESVAKSLLFAGEAVLTEPVRGTSSFAAEFCVHGPRDRQGRSLREFDLHTRMFRYPCSYLIYSPAFRQLPLELKQGVYRHLNSALSAPTPIVQDARLTPEVRGAIAEILRDTIPEFAELWKARPQP